MRLVREMPEGWRFSEENLVHVPEGYARIYNPETPDDGEYYIKVEKLPDTEIDFDSLKAGDQIATVCLGEYYIATINTPENGYYRMGQTRYCWYPKDIMTVKDAIRKAEEEREKYYTIVPENLTELYHMEYVREIDGYHMWGQIGYYEDMLFWKHECTYQFLEKRGKLTDRNWKKLYAGHMDDLAGRAGFSHGKQVYEEHPMDRLYLCADGTTYASADYAMRNKPVVK